MDTNVTGDGKPKRITRIDPTKLDVDVQNKLKSALARIKAPSTLSKIKKPAVLKPHNKVAVITHKQQQQCMPQDPVTTSTATTAAVAADTTAMKHDQPPETAAAIATTPSHVGQIKPVPLKQMQHRPMGLVHDSEFAGMQPKILDPVKNLIRDRIKLQLQKKSEKQAALQPSTSKPDRPQDLLSTAEMKQNDAPPTVPMFSIELVKEPVIVPMSASEMDAKLSPDPNEMAPADIAHIPIIIMSEAETGRTQLEEHNEPRPTVVEEQPMNPTKKISILENVEVKGTEYMNLQISQSNVSIITPERPKKTKAAPVRAANGLDGDSNLSADDEGEESFVGFETDDSDMATLKKKCIRFFNKFDSKVNKASLELAKVELVRDADEPTGTYSKRSSESSKAAEEKSEAIPELRLSDNLPSVEQPKIEPHREAIVEQLESSVTDDTTEGQPTAQGKEGIVNSHPTVIEAEISSSNKEAAKKSTVNKAPMRKMKFKPNIPGRSTKEAVPIAKSKPSAVIKTAKQMMRDMFKTVSSVKTSKMVETVEEGQPNSKEDSLIIPKETQPANDTNIEDKIASSSVCAANSNAEEHQPVEPISSVPVAILKDHNASTNEVKEDTLKATALANEPERQDPVTTKSKEESGPVLIERPNMEPHSCDSMAIARETGNPSKRSRAARVVGKKLEDQVLNEPSRESKPLDEELQKEKDVPKCVSPIKSIQPKILEAEENPSVIENSHEKTTVLAPCVETSSAESSAVLLPSTIPEQVETVTPKICKANTSSKRPRVSRIDAKEVVVERKPEEAVSTGSSKCSVDRLVPSITSNVTPFKAIPASKSEEQSIMSLLKNTPTFKELCEQINSSSHLGVAVNDEKIVNNMDESVTIPKTLFEKYFRTEQLLKDLLMAQQQKEMQIVDTKAPEEHYPAAREEMELTMGIETGSEELLAIPVVASSAESSPLHDYEDIHDHISITKEPVTNEGEASEDHQSGIEVLNEVVPESETVAHDLPVIDLSKKDNKEAKEVVNPTKGARKIKNLISKDSAAVIISSRRSSIRLGKAPTQEPKETSKTHTDSAGKTSIQSPVEPPKRRQTIDEKWTTPGAKSQNLVTKSSRKLPKEPEKAQKDEQNEQKAEKSTNSEVEIPEPVATNSINTPINPPKRQNKDRRMTIDEKGAVTEAKSEELVAKSSRKRVAKLSDPVMNKSKEAASRELNVKETATDDSSEDDDVPVPRSSSRVRKGTWKSEWNIVPSPTKGSKLTMTLKRPLRDSSEVSEKDNLAVKTKKIGVTTSECNVVLQRINPDQMPAKSTTPEVATTAKVSVKPSTKIGPRSRISLGKSSTKQSLPSPKIVPAESEQSLLSLLTVIPPTKKRWIPQDIPVLQLKKSAPNSISIVPVEEPAKKKQKVESPVKARVSETSLSPAVTPKPSPPEKRSRSDAITPKSVPTPIGIKTSMIANKSSPSPAVTPQPESPGKRRRRAQAITPTLVSTKKTPMIANKPAPKSKSSKMAKESPPLVDMEIFLREQSEIAAENQLLPADDQAKETKPVLSKSTTTSPATRKTPAPTTQVKINQFFAKADKVTADPKTATPQFNVCGNCKESVPIKSWNSHAKQHYGLSWIEGIDNPIDLDEDAKVARIVHKHMQSNRIKLLKCAKCNVQKKSAVGYASHIRYCGLTSNEAEAKTAECMYCQKKMKSVSVSAHMAYCHVLGRMRKKEAALEKAKQREQNQEDLSGASFSGRGRRLKAVSKLADLDIRLHYKRNTFYNRVQKRWANEAAQGIALKCFSRMCRFQTNELREIEAHHTTCKMAQTYKFACRLCLHDTVLQVDIEEHIRKEHFSKSTGKGNNDESEAESDDQSDASVGTESSQSEGESGDEEDDDYERSEESGDSDGNSKKVKSRRRDPVSRAENTIKFWQELQMTEFSKKHKTFARENFSWDPLFPQWSPPEADKLETVANMFEASVENGPEKGAFANIHCGMAIERVAWVPVPPKADPVLALLCKPKSVPHMKMSHKERRETIVQLWRLNASFEATHVYSIVRPDGPICAMKFCPSGGYEEGKRLALLALTSVNGDVNIVALPPVRAEYEGMGLRLPPSCTLKAGVDSVGTSVDWDSRKGHSSIVSGFLNGMIVIWKVTGRRKCSLALDEDGSVFPVKVFQPFNGPVNTLEINMNHFLACAGPTLKIFDMDHAHETMTLARTVLDISCAQWVPYTPYFMSGQSRATVNSGLYLQQVFNLRHDTFRMISTQLCVSAVSFSPVLGMLVAGTADGDVWLRHLLKSSSFGPFTKPGRKFKRLLSTNSAGVVTDMKVNIWEKKKESANPEAVISIELVQSPGEFQRWYAVGYENGMVRVTELPRGE